MLIGHWILLLLRLCVSRSIYILAKRETLNWHWKYTCCIYSTQLFFTFVFMERLFQITCDTLRLFYCCNNSWSIFLFMHNLAFMSLISLWDRLWRSTLYLSRESFHVRNTVKIFFVKCGCAKCRWTQFYSNWQFWTILLD